MDVMSPRDGEDVRTKRTLDRWRTDRAAVGIGTAATALATLGFFSLPELVGSSSVSTGIPIEHLRWFGGAVGALVAGTLAPDHGSGIVTGTKAAVYGLGVAYLLAIALYFGYAGVIAGTFPPPGLAIVAVLLYYAIPLAITHLSGGIVLGRLGRLLRDRIQ